MWERARGAWNGGVGVESESTWSRVRLEIHCAALISDIRVQSLEPDALAMFWRLLAYTACGGLPVDPIIIGRLANMSSRKVKRHWPAIEPFYERAGDHWTLKPNEWAFPYVVAEKRERQSLRHLFRRLVAFWGRSCVYCGNQLERLAIEHIVPRARGGGDEITNLTLSCQRCNSKKRTKTAAEFGHPGIHDKAQRIQ